MIEQHEQTLRLLPGQTTFIFSPRDIVNDIIADVIFGYYPGEEGPEGFPFKIALKPSLQSLFEIAFSEEQIRTIIAHFERMLRRRSKIPHGVSDNQQPG